MDIAQWRELDDQIFLMIDLNENITLYTVIEIFENLGLVEAISHHHCATGLVPVYQR